MIDFNEANLNMDVFPPANGIQIVEFRGNLDKAGFNHIREQMEETVEKCTSKFLIFNFAKLEFINSESIGFLLTLHSRLIKKDSRLVIVSANSHVKDVLEVIGMTKLVDMYDDLQKFTESLKS